MRLPARRVPGGDYAEVGVVAFVHPVGKAAGAAGKVVELGPSVGGKFVAVYVVQIGTRARLARDDIPVLVVAYSDGVVPSYAAMAGHGLPRLGEAPRAEQQRKEGE